VDLPLFRSQVNEQWHAAQGKGHTAIDEWQRLHEIENSSRQGYEEYRRVTPLRGSP
jgi:hypothetical protein